MNRIENLRRQALDKVHESVRQRKPMSVLGSFGTELSVVERKAEGFVMMLEQMPKAILDHELIVGVRSLFAPRSGSRDSDGELSKNLDFVPDAETLAVESPGFEFYPEYLSDSEKNQAADLGIGEGYVTSHCAAGFEKVLDLGFAGIRKEAEQSLKNYRGNEKKEAFLRAVLRIHEGIEGFILDYAALAEDLAGKAELPRKSELKTIAGVCRRIAIGTPETFHEALQSVWFTHLFMLMENYNLMSLGRPDQYLLSYYLNDIESGRITQDDALELLSCLFVKLNDGSDLHTDNGLNIIVSGLRPDGSDGTNALSWLFVDAYEEVRLVDPQINIRWHYGTPREFLKRIMRMKGRSSMPPMLFNDEVLIPGLQAMGVELKDARDYCIDACQDVLIPGKSDFYPIFAGTYGIHLLKIFERILPTLTDYDSFDEFYRSFLDELRSDVAETVKEANTIDTLLPEISPTPVLSMTLENCVASGLDKTSGGAKYNFTGFIGGGLVNIADSMAAIKEHVFERKTVDAAELLEALGKNFKGFDHLRATLKNMAPKWGNADERVDGYGREIAATFSTEVKKYQNSRGGRFIPGLMTHHQVRLGKVVGATPDGRRQGEALAISLSPSIGQMKKGPTCALNSALAVDHKEFPVGTSVDLTIQSSFLRTEDDLDKVITMTESFFEGGGLEVQYNVLDPEVLRQAQARPEEYKDLVVRVWGFNAYFITLQKDYQDELIARAETGIA